MLLPVVSVVDERRVRQRLGLLSRYRDRLAARAAAPLSEDDEDAMRYEVQVAAQICIDLAGHVIASEGWRFPQDYAETFTILEEHGVIDSELAARLRSLAGLRNIIVHLYTEVDDDRVHGDLERGLGDLDRFAEAIVGLLT